jgi:ABC-type glutathione transport system ATPase component
MGRPAAKSSAVSGASDDPNRGKGANRALEDAATTLALLPARRISGDQKRGRRLLIEIAGVSRMYQRAQELVKAVDDVTLTLGNENLVAITGASGSGKRCRSSFSFSTCCPP